MNRAADNNGSRLLLLLTFFHMSLLQKMHTWGTGGHEALVCSTFHKSYKHGRNEHTGKRKVDSRYISKDNIGLRLYTCMDSNFLLVAC